MLKIHEETLDKIYTCKNNNETYKNAVKEFKEALESNDLMKIDSAVNWMETTACDLTYKKGFQDGMNFILNTMAGKEVIEI